MTIKNPPAALEEATPDKLEVGHVLDVSPHLGILMIAAGWVRSETRSSVRRQRESLPRYNRRETVDRRSDRAP